MCQNRLAPSRQYEHGVPGEEKPEEWQYGQREEWRACGGVWAELKHD